MHKTNYGELLVSMESINKELWNFLPIYFIFIHTAVSVCSLDGNFIFFKLARKTTEHILLELRMIDQQILLISQNENAHKTSQPNTLQTINQNSSEKYYEAVNEALYELNQQE